MAASMRRRRKLRYGRQVSNLEEARKKTLELGKLMADTVRDQVQAHDYDLIDINEALPAEEVLLLVGHHFEPFLARQFDD